MFEWPVQSSDFIKNDQWILFAELSLRLRLLSFSTYKNKAEITASLNHRIGTPVSL